MKRLYYILLGLTTLFCSCNDWLDITPKTNVEEKDLFKNEQGFKEALTGVYIKMSTTQLYGREMTYGFIDQLAQRYFNNESLETDYDKITWYTYPSTRTQTYYETFWTSDYNLIANLNNLLDNIEKRGNVIHTAGYKDITLLGQNVNSYGKDLDTDYDFADLLAAINAIPGDYWLRFMSSQPKDATNKLFDTMARCEHVAKQLHLPVQSGCDRVLKAMNRPYTRAKYEEMIAYARSVMPGMVLTSDVIIGFPGETEDEAMQTVDLVEKTQFDALFTFIFSPRPGTPAAKMDDPVSREEKQVWFEKLVDAQNAISAKKHAAYIGRTVKVLVDGESDDEAFPLAARTEGNRLVRMKGERALIGTFAKAKITDSNTWALYGEAVEE